MARQLAEKGYHIESDIPAIQDFSSIYRYAAPQAAPPEPEESAETPQDTITEPFLNSGESVETINLTPAQDNLFGIDTTPVVAPKKERAERPSTGNPNQQHPAVKVWKETMAPRFVTKLNPTGQRNPTGVQANAIADAFGPEPTDEALAGWKAALTQFNVNSRNPVAVGDQIALYERDHKPKPKPRMAPSRQWRTTNLNPLPPNYHERVMGRVTEPSNQRPTERPEGLHGPTFLPRSIPQPVQQRPDHWSAYVDTRNAEADEGMEKARAYAAQIQQRIDAGENVPASEIPVWL